MRSATLQRSCSCGGKCGSCLGRQAILPVRTGGIARPPLRSPGQPLDAQTRANMESRFGHDFSSVRLHTDGDAAPQVAGPPASPAEAEADRVADRVVAGENAGPVGAPPVRTGKALKGFAHKECGRKTNMRVAGFDNTTAGPHISAISVDIKTEAHSPVTLTWANVPAGVTVPSVLNGSPGAGKCSMRRKDLGKGQHQVDCSDPAWSNTKDSLCTPIGNFLVEGYSCKISKTATSVTWFQKKRAIAFHNYHEVPEYPASHGCVRIADGQADWIYDNTIPNVTTVAINRPAGNPGPKCYGPDDKLKDHPGYVAPPTPAPAGSGGESTDTQGDGP